MRFGKLLSYETDGQRVRFHFENGDGRIEVFTEKILNVFAGVISEEHRSYAIEGEKVKKTDFAVQKNGASLSAGVSVSTGFVTAKVFDDFKVDFYRADGTVICRDYRGNRTPRGTVCQEVFARLSKLNF